MKSPNPSTHLIATMCDRCRAGLELECRGHAGFWGFLSYNEYLCPACGRRNHIKSSGTVVAVRRISTSAA